MQIPKDLIEEALRSLSSVANESDFFKVRSQFLGKKSFIQLSFKELKNLDPEKKVLSSTKGHYGARSRLYKTAKQSNIKSLQYAFRDRKNKKRTFRSLWIARISAALNDHEISYSRFINILT